MSDLMVAGADRSAPATPPTAAELAARIPVPRRLPQRHDGEPLRHLSPSSYMLKVKNSLITKVQADSEPQAGIYLAGRWLENYPAAELLFAQIAKAGKRRKQMGASVVPTTRTTGQMRGVLARVALAASQIAASYERCGPDRPWGFADPTSWKCSPRFCSAWGSCPGGRGL